MKNIWKLSTAYLWHYKKQTISILIGMIISMGLLTGIGTLIRSGEESSMVRTKEIYGDWHCSVTVKKELWNKMEPGMGKGEKRYTIEQAGLLEVKGIGEDSRELQYVYGDETYRSMLGRYIEQGTYPGTSDEVALDAYTITNLGLSSTIGGTVTLGGNEYRLCGIISNRWTVNAGQMQVFVSEGFNGQKENQTWYIKFKEKNVMAQIERFCKDLSVNNSQREINWDVAEYYGGMNFNQLQGIVMTGLSLQRGKIGYIFGSIKTRCHLLENGILLCLGMFGAFVVYSIYNISISRRISGYSILYTLGIEDRSIFGIIITELCTLFAVGYPLGCLLGNGTARLFYSKIGTAFVSQNIGAVQAGVHISDSDKFYSVSKVQPGDFVMSYRAVWFGLLLLLVLFMWISLKIYNRVKKDTLLQLMKADESPSGRKRKIYSSKSVRMTNILTRKLMFAKPGVFFGIVISLSLGGVIFLGSTCVIENTKKNNELSSKTDDGLASDLQVFEDSDRLSDMIPSHTMDEISKLEGISKVYPVKYLLGEIPLQKSQVIWDSYCAEIADDPSHQPDPRMMEKYNGRCLRENDGNYKMKVNIYGYDDNLFMQLEDYVLEGSINPESIKTNNMVILKTWMDGQGNYGGIDLKPGDTITLKVPKDTDVPDNILKFQAEDSWYIEKEYVIGGIVSRPMAKNNRFIGDDGKSNLDIIMSNEQMEDNYGITGYNMASIQMKKGEDSASLQRQIVKLTAGILRCTVKDFTGAIEAHQIYLKQKMYFFYGVSIIVFVISMLHILNCIYYLVLSRRREFGILRAMGITDAGFLNMMLREGFLYGIYASGFMLLAYWPVKKILYYFMKHIWRYIMPTESIASVYILAMIGVNIFLAAVAVFVPVKRILEDDIVDELKGESAS